MEDPSGREVLDVDVRGRLRRQGLTEFFFESAEPTFDDLSPAEFFARFPEGEYEIEGTTLDGEELESTTELTHLMPAPPAPTVNTIAIPDGGFVCDTEDPAYNAPEVSTSITIAWEEVTSSHPGLGIMPPEEIEVHNYEVVVEADVEIGNDEELTVIFSAIVPPEVRSMTIPDELIDLATEWKYEILVREESFNQTAVESCFQIANGE
jgi:hypothetical protein